MAEYEKYSLRPGNKFYAVAVCSALVLILGSLLFQHPGNISQSKAPSTVVKTDDNVDSISNPLLYESDQELYKQIFSAQKAADWEAADEGISKLSSDLLLGDVLAERYLHRHYDTTSNEIIAWLKNYSDHSETPDILEMANRKYPEVFSKMPKTERPLALSGYGDESSDDIRFNDNPQARKLWSYGIEAWRNGKKSESAKSFALLADKKKNLSDWQYSAASFWAYRSFVALGDKEKANYYLNEAATNPRVFYGMLAYKQLDKPLELDTRFINISQPDIKKLLGKAKIQRIIALAQSGLNERAEAQLRLLFTSSDRQEKWLLLSLANKLHLASAQISMAKQLDNNERQLDMLKYPVPAWKPTGGFNIDPDLLYALMRQESGFRSSAISPGGALGLMQLMPQTARKMQATVPFNDEISKNLNISEPVLNITLGERYVEHLLGNNLVNNNLFYMLAAYNAGPKRLKEWQDNISYNDDPLLFVESIPYSETRHYVLQVMTNYWVYSELDGKKNASIYSVLQGSWPIYSAPDASVADSGRRERNG